jgi:hypothetical protein
VARRSAPEYVGLAAQGIRELLAQEFAAVPAEMEARISDTKWPTLPSPVDPHHITTARRQLANSGIIRPLTATTLGRRSVTVFHPSDTRGRLTDISRAAARKRLLQGRYQGWASGSAAQQGVIGPAAENVLHASLLAAAPLGYRLVNREGSGVRSVLGAPVPGGPLDSAAFLTTLDEAELPQPPILLAIEVKNIRAWIYPRAPELHQVLYKSAALHVANPEIPVVPMLMCRRANAQTFWMAAQLGFQVLEARAQFLPTNLDSRAVDEVRRELGYFDLTQTEGSHPAIIHQLTNAIPPIAGVRATTWGVSAPLLIDHFETLRDPTLPNADRDAAMAELREAANEALDIRGGW